MKKERVEELERMLNLVNHKTGKKLNINETVKKAVKSGILNEAEGDLDLGFDTGFEEETPEKVAGSDPKYYANKIAPKPEGSEKYFDLPYRCWLVGTFSGIIKQYVSRYNMIHEDNKIETFNEDDKIYDRKIDFGKGILGIPGAFGEMQKYVFEFYTRVYTRQLNPIEKEFSETNNNCFASDTAIKYATIILNFTLRNAVTENVISSVNIKFDTPEETERFNIAQKEAIDKILKIAPEKYDATQGNFNAWATQVMKNVVKNKLAEVSEMIPTAAYFSTIIDTLGTNNIKTNANYTRKLEAKFGKKIEKFTDSDWNKLKEESDSNFSESPKIFVGEKARYLVFNYSDKIDLAKDILNANTEKMSQHSGSISLSPGYYSNILDGALKKSVFKAVEKFPKISLKPAMSIVKPGHEDEEETKFKANLHPEDVYGANDYDYAGSMEDPGISSFEIKDITSKLLPTFSSYAFIKNKLSPFAIDIAGKKIEKLFYNIDDLKNNPEGLELYLSFLGEIFMFIFKDTMSQKSSRASVKATIAQKVEELQKKYNQLVEKIPNGEEIKSKFVLPNDYIDGLNIIANRIIDVFKKDKTKEEKIKTKETKKQLSNIMKGIISESRREKLLAKLLKENKTILNEAAAEEVKSVVSNLTTNAKFSKKFNELSEKERMNLIEKTADILSGKINRTQKFNIKLPANSLVISILLFIVSSSSISNESIKQNAYNALFAIIYNNVGLLKLVAKMGAGEHYNEEMYEDKYEDLVLNAVEKKMSEIKNSNSFDPSKSNGITFLVNILKNKFIDLLKSSKEKIIGKTISIDAPSKGTGDFSDEEENKFGWFQKDASGSVLPAEGDAEELNMSEPEIEPTLASGKGFEKMLQNVSSKYGFNLKQFIKNKFSDKKIFSYEKSGAEYYILAKDNHFLTIQDMVLLMLEFMSGKGEPSYYSEQGSPKYAKFIDYVITDKGNSLYNLNTKKTTTEIDNLTDNDPSSIRPNRVAIFRLQEGIRKAIMEKMKQAKEKGSLFEEIKNKINPIIKKYYLIKESKKKDVELEEERIANPDGKEFVDKHENFIGSQVFGEDIGNIGKDTDWKDGMYGVFSYGIQFPIYIYTNLEFEDQDGDKKNKDGKFRWFGNIEDYKFDIDEDGKSEIMKSVQKHKELLKPSASIHGLTRATMVDMIKSFMKKHKIKSLSHTSIKPGEGQGIHFGKKREE